MIKIAQGKVLIICEGCGDVYASDRKLSIPTIITAWKEQGGLISNNPTYNPHVQGSRPYLHWCANPCKPRPTITPDKRQS